MRLAGLLLCLLAGAASAQGVLITRGSSTPSATRTDTARYYIATATTGSAFSCNAQLASCVDLGPGSCNSLGTDGSGNIVMGGTSCSPTILIGGGGNISISGATITMLNAALNAGWKTAIVNTVTGYPVWVNEENGFYIQPYSSASLPTCGAANVDGSATGSVVPEGTLRTVAAAGSRTRMCLCTSDGGGTPAYSWRNLFDPATSGTSTTCPATP